MLQEISESTPFLESPATPVFTNSEADRQKTRWVVFAGNDLPLKFRTSFQGARIGGMYLGHNYKCLAPTRHLIRRCEITPFVVGYDFINSDLLGDNTQGAVAFQDWNADTRTMEKRYAYRTLPGDELASLMSAMQGPMDIGVREIEMLKGEDEPKKIDTGWTRTKAEDLQLEIFPDWPQYLSGEKDFFPTAAELRIFLTDRRNMVGSDAREVIRVTLESLERFVTWESERLSAKGNLVKAPISQDGRVYSWDETDFERFDHTGLQREDILAKPVNENQEAVTRDELKEMFAPVAAFMKQQVQKEESSSAQPAEDAEARVLASGTPIHIGDRPAKIVEKKGGGYYAVKFDDGGSEGNYRPAQMTFTPENFGAVGDSE